MESDYQKKSRKKVKSIIKKSEIDYKKEVKSIIKTFSRGKNHEIDRKINIKQRRESLHVFFENLNIMDDEHMTIRTKWRRSTRKKYQK